jgi:hypothetical protein
LDVVFELIVMFLGVAVYGTIERPRHHFVRYSVRVIAFGGALLLMLWMLVPNAVSIPISVFVIWAICGITVTLAELEFGRSRIAFAAWGMATLLIIIAVKRGF